MKTLNTIIEKLQVDLEILASEKDALIEKLNKKIKRLEDEIYNMNVPKKVYVTPRSQSTEKDKKRLEFEKQYKTTQYGGKYGE